MGFPIQWLETENRFDWTKPIPLDGTAKTRLIYIKELLDAIDYRYNELGSSYQLPSFYSHEKFRKWFYEEIQKEIDNLIIQFGYASVEDSELLGRPWAELPQRTHHSQIKYEWDYALLEDFRKVLDRLLSTAFLEKFEDLTYQPIKVYYYAKANPTNPLADVIINDNLYCYYAPPDTNWSMGYIINQTFSLGIKADPNSFCKVEITNDRKYRITHKVRNFIGAGVGYYIRESFGRTEPRDINTVQFPVADLKITEKLCLDFDCYFNDISSWSGGQDLPNKPQAGQLVINVRIASPTLGTIALYYGFRPNFNSGDIPGGATSVDFFINNTNLTYFARNIYDDYITAIGSPPPSDAYILDVNFFTYLRMYSPLISDGNWYEIITELDNIGVRSIYSPDITPVFHI